MELINFKDIDFNKSINKDLKTFEFNGTEIGIIPYLSIENKYDFVMITLQKSLEKGIYNLVKLDMYFDLHLVYMYTNINFSEEDREDEAELYNIMTKSGFIDKVKENISCDEIDILKTYIQDMQDIIIYYKNTFGTALANFLEQLPENMEKAKTFIEEFDPEKLKTLTDMISDLQK